MANPDPYGDPYREQPPQRLVARDGMSPMLLAGIALGVMLIVGGLLYAYNQSGSPVASNPPAQTTGQGQNNAPPAANVPAPTDQLKK